MKAILNPWVPRAAFTATRPLAVSSFSLLILGVGVLPDTCNASELYVGNFFGSESDVLRYNGTTGAFETTFVPHGSGGLTFPLGAAFGPDGNFYVSNSDNDTVVRYSGLTGAFLNVFATSVEDPAGMVFVPGNALDGGRTCMPPIHEPLTMLQAGLATQKTLVELLAS